MCVCGGGGGCLCVCVTVESGSFQITSHPFNKVLSPTGLLSGRGNSTWKQLTSAYQTYRTSQCFAAGMACGSR